MRREQEAGSMGVGAGGRKREAGEGGRKHWDGSDMQEA
jgi:hypothetical protein